MRGSRRSMLAVLGITFALTASGCLGGTGTTATLDGSLLGGHASDAMGQLLRQAARSQVVRGVSDAADPSPSATKKPKPSASPGASKEPKSGGGPQASDPVLAAPTTRYGFPGSAILGRPTATSAALSLYSAKALTVYVEYGRASGAYTARTKTIAMKARTPTVLTLTGLAPDALTYYRIRYRASGSTTFAAATQQSFRTQRAAGSSFTFAVDADPHIDVDKKTQPALLRAALTDIRADRPDFLIDLGDTFLGDKFAQSASELAFQYANVRDYFGISGPSVPLFLANGNHEGEDGWALTGSADVLPVWAAKDRKAFYPVPSIGSFYSGSTEKAPDVGERDSYYAWEWGDALFVVLDPYTYTTTDPRKSGDIWDWTLGDDQYAWLVKTLSTSDAPYKFVFSHHVLGEGRGMVELAGLGEWGGHGRNGTDRFAAERPGWAMPVHDVFVKYGVTIFFQGHDHLYARQELDGVVYQEVPQPATTGDPANEGAYTSGTVLPAPGTLRVRVGSTGVTVDYVRSAVTFSGTPAPENGTVVTSYSIPRG
jgi:hypothetical protein